MSSEQPLSARDRVAQVICNWVLRHIASEWYRIRIASFVRYGMDAAARDIREGIPAPPPWQESP